jgi:regulator of PEP synthase PpsR (kinase-PPPase family)
MVITKREAIATIEAIEFMLAHMTDDGSEEKAIDRGFHEEVKLIRKLRNEL